MSDFSFTLDWANQPLTEVDLAILAIETTAGDDRASRDEMVETILGWTAAYYEENVRCLAHDNRVEAFSPGLMPVLLARYPGEPLYRAWPGDEAFTRPNHL